MSESFIKKIYNWVLQKKHIFLIKSSEPTNTTDIVNSIYTSTNNTVDVYSDCRELFYKLNSRKNYYYIGIIDKNDKKNTGNILKNIIQTINPNIKIITYSKQTTLIDELNSV